MTATLAEQFVLERLQRRADLRANGVPEYDLPPVPADLLQPADWNLLERTDR